MGLLAWVVVMTAVAGVGGTGLGGLVGAVLNRDSNKGVSLLLSFAGGVMLAVVCFDLIQNAIVPEGAVAPTNIFIVLAGILAGFVLVWLLNDCIDRRTNREVRHIDRAHPKTADDLDELIHADHLAEHSRNTDRRGLFAAGIVMALAIALHNIPEGMVIGASYANSGQLAGGSGMVLAIIIGLHNIPEGMAVAVPLISGGMKKWKAVLITALSGAPTVLGALLGFWLGTLGPLWLALSLSFASGAMLYVVFGELLPESILMWRSKLPALAVMVGVAVGLIIIYL